MNYFVKKQKKMGKKKWKNKKKTKHWSMDKIRHAIIGIQAWCRRSSSVITEQNRLGRIMLLLLRTDTNRAKKGRCVCVCVCEGKGEVEKSRLNWEDGVRDYAFQLKTGPGERGNRQGGGTTGLDTTTC